MTAPTTSPAGVNGEAAVFSDRAKKRLRIAAALLRGQGMSFEVARERFYPHVLQAIEALPEDRRVHLRSLVDWVEQYEDAEVAN